MSINPKKINKPIIITEGHTSIFIFLIPLILIISTIVYSLSSNKLNIFLTLFLCILYLVYPVTHFFKRKITVTNNKVYFYFLGKKKISIHYLDDFYIIDYQQDRLGKLLNYGTLTIIDDDKNAYQYSFLNNIFTIYETIVIAYEDYLVKKEPEYVRRYVKEVNKDSLDSLDSLDRLPPDDNIKEIKNEVEKEVQKEKE